MIYPRGASLDEIERLAHTSGDTATLALLDQCLDAAGTRRAEAIERAVAMRASVQEASTAAARIVELQEAHARLQDKLRAADRLLCAVRFTLKPWQGKPTRPKWAQYLTDTLSRIYKETTL